MKIERPDWAQYDVATTVFVGHELSSFNPKQWFDNYVEPINKMLADGVEVYQYNQSYLWQEKYDELKHDQKAILINIQPIKKETREEKLEKVCKKFLSEGPTPQKNVWMQIYDEAKKVLNEA